MCGRIEGFEGFEGFGDWDWTGLGRWLMRLKVLGLELVREGLGIWKDFRCV